MTLRPLPAGPMMPLEGPQMLGPVEVHYALAVGDVDPYRMAADVLDPLLDHGFVRRRRPARPRLGPQRARRRGLRGAAGGRPGGGAGVQSRDPTATTVEIAGRSGWLVDLRGRPVAPFEGSFELRPQGIATARLDGD